MFNIYYKIIKDDKAEKGMSVVCLQEFDEKDYYQDLFIKDKDGNVLIFNTEEAAQEYIDRSKLYIVLFDKYLEVLGLYATKELAIKACKQHCLKMHMYNLSIDDCSITKINNVIVKNKTHIDIISRFGKDSYSIYEEDIKNK